MTDDNTTDDLEDVPGEHDPDDVDQQPEELEPHPNDGPVPMQAGEDA